MADEEAFRLDEVLAAGVKDIAVGFSRPMLPMLLLLLLLLLALELRSLAPDMETVAGGSQL